MGNGKKNLKKISLPGASRTPDLQITILYHITVWRLKPTWLPRVLKSVAASVGIRVLTGPRWVGDQGAGGTSSHVGLFVVFISWFIPGRNKTGGSLDLSHDRGP